MTRKLLLGLFVAIILSVAPQAQATIGPFVSWQNADDLDNGYGLGVALPRSLTPIIRIDPRVTWYSYSGGDYDLNAFPIDLIAEIDLGLFYGGVGGSYTIYDHNISNRWGYSFVAGAKLQLGGLGIFGELMWRGSEKDEANVDGFGLNVGVLFGAP